MTQQPLAYIHPNAKIGKDVVIEPFATIYDNVEIGDGTHIASHATIMPFSKIGNNCHIHSGAVIGGEPQDLKYKGEETWVIIGDNTTIRECATVNRGTASKGVTKVGNNCLIMAYCHVAHDCNIGNNVIMSNATQVAGEVVIDDFAVVGGGSLIHQFTHIGAHVMLQGGSHVNKDIPPFAMAGREPISYAGINSVGLRRRNFTDDQIITIQKVYHILYLSGLNNTEAIEKINEEIKECPERDIIVNFVKNSNRGIIRGMV